MFRQMEADGVAVPESAEQPELYPHLGSIWDAFTRLSRGRQDEMGPCPIVLSEITAYCDMIGVFGTEDRLDCVDLIQAMDAEYLTIQRKKQDGG